MNEKLKLFDPTSQPVPQQRVPFWVRWPLRVIAFPVMAIDQWAQRIVLSIFKPRYKLEGACKKRGRCCQFIHFGWPKSGKLSFFSKLYVLWQTEILGFYFKSFDFTEDGEVTKVMGCRYLLPNGKCKHYFLRPGLCRNWPKLHYLRQPQLIKGCGYKVALRKKIKEVS